jgi:alkylation response protein AidB-like acyl-CoA dehydrogenase
MPHAPATVHAVRAEVADWLSRHWDPHLSLRAWRELLLQARWAVPSWPERWFGRGLPAWADAVVAEEIKAAGAVGNPLGGGMTLAAPTILAHGTDAQCERFLRATLTGELTWCQLFSEPGSGSDLAGLRASAVRDGDEWIVNGQKVWTTSAHHADFGILLARTDADLPKHQGISYFLLPMHQPGVEVRPIVQMNRHRSFNEVFLTDARVPAENLLGAPGDGWRIAQTTLMHERSFATMRRATSDGHDPSAPRALREAEEEAEHHYSTYAWYPQRAGRAELVPARAVETGRAADPVVRQEVARLVSFVRASQWTAERARAARALGRPPGPEGSLGKLAASEVARRAARAHALVSGARALLTDGPDALDAVVAEILVSVPAQSIAGGTDEIQRSILGERVLGLPKEPAVDRDVPFRSVPRN